MDRKVGEIMERREGRAIIIYWGIKLRRVFIVICYCELNNYRILMVDISRFFFGFEGFVLSL